MICYYLIIEKNTNIIQALLEMDGSYLLDTSTRYSIRIPNKLVFDFEAYMYTLNKDTGVISRIPRVSEDTESLITTLEVSFE